MEQVYIQRTGKTAAFPLRKGESRKWFGGIQALRGILFIIVFLSHSGQFFSITGIIGAAAVECFFICSGFLSGYFNEETKKVSFACCIASLRKRLAAFYPFYIVWLLFFALFMRSWGWRNFIKCVFLLQSYFGNAEAALSFNWPCWFLSSILLSYFLDPLLNKLCRKVKTKGIWAMAGLFLFQIIFSFLWRNNAEAYSLGYYYVYMFPPIRMIDYIQGILLAGLFKNRNQDSADLEENVCNIIEAGVALLFIGEMSLCHLLPVVLVYTVIWAPVSAALVWMFAAQKGGISRMLTCKFLLWLGSISFELYIVHRLVIVIFSDISTDMWAYAAAFTVTLLLGYAASCLKQIIKAKDRRIGRIWQKKKEI